MALARACALVSLVAVAGCAAAKPSDAPVATYIATDVATAAASVKGFMQKACPVATANVSRVQELTQFVATALGYPATGSVLVNLEADAVKVCGAAIAQTTP